MDSEAVRSPGPPAPGSIGVRRALVLLLVFYGIVILVSIMMRVVTSLAGVSLDAPSSLLIETVVAWPVTVRLAMRRLGTSFGEAMPLRPFAAAVVPAALLAGLGGSFLLIEVANWIPAPDAFTNRMLELGQGNRAVLFAIVVVVGPVLEELFFRGILLRGFLARYSVTKAVWFSALLFALFHLNPWQAVVAIPVGLLCAWLVLRTGSLVPGMLVHVAANYTGAFLMGQVGEMLGYSSEQLLDAPHVPLAMLAIGAAAVAIAALVLWRQFGTGMSRA